MRPFDHLHFFLMGLTLVCNLARAGIRKGEEERRRFWQADSNRPSIELILACGSRGGRVYLCPWSCWSRSRRTDRARSGAPPPPPARPGAPSRPLWPITFGIAIRRVSRRSAVRRLGLKYGRATGKAGREGAVCVCGGGGAKLRGKDLRFEAKQSVCEVGFRVFFQPPPPHTPLPIFLVL